MSFMKLVKIGRYFENEYDGPPGPQDDAGGDGVRQDITELIVQVIEGRGERVTSAACVGVIDEAVRVAKDLEEEARAEQAYERRAAFGPGVEVVNIVTGERTRT